MLEDTSTTPKLLVSSQDPLLAQIGFALWRELEQPAPARLYAQTAAQMLAVHLLQHYTSSLGNYSGTEQFSQERT